LTYYVINTDITSGIVGTEISDVNAGGGTIITDTAAGTVAQAGSPAGKWGGKGQSQASDRLLMRTGDRGGGNPLPPPAGLSFLEECGGEISDLMSLSSFPPRSLYKPCFLLW
jgi:hypothetical protein